MRFHRNYAMKPVQKNNKPRFLLACCFLGIMAVTMSACCEDNREELQKVRKENEQLSNGINSVLKGLNEKRAKLVKSLPSEETLSKAKEDEQRLNKAEKDGLGSLVPGVKNAQATATAKSKSLEEKKNSLNEEIEFIDDLKKELNALYSKSENSTPKHQ